LLVSIWLLIVVWLLVNINLLLVTELLLLITDSLLGMLDTDLLTTSQLGLLADSLSLGFLDTLLDTSLLDALSWNGDLLLTELDLIVFDTLGNLLVLLAESLGLVFGTESLLLVSTTLLEGLLFGTELLLLVGTTSLLPSNNLALLDMSILDTLLDIGVDIGVILVANLLLFTLLDSYFFKLAANLLMIELGALGNRLILVTVFLSLLASTELLTSIRITDFVCTLLTTNLSGAMLDTLFVFLGVLVTFVNGFVL